MVIWPDLHFGPVNLLTVVSADMFYESPEQQWEKVWKDQQAFENVAVPQVHRHAYRMPEIMRRTFASR